MKIACLHTLDANAALFDAALEGAAGGADVTLVHRVREDLLQRAIDRGEADDEIIGETAAALEALGAESGADGVLLTCTTIAPGAERAGAVRVDAALAEQAAAEAGASGEGGGVVEALITIPTTEQATRTIFEDYARKTGATVRVTLVEGALAAFQARDLDAYARLIAQAADGSEADVVALAQASMAPAAALASRAVLTSPAAGLAAAIRAAEGRAEH